MRGHEMTGTERGHLFLLVWTLLDLIFSGYLPENEEKWKMQIPVQHKYWTSTSRTYWQGRCGTLGCALVVVDLAVLGLFLGSILKVCPTYTILRFYDNIECGVLCSSQQNSLWKAWPRVRHWKSNVGGYFTTTPAPEGTTRPSKINPMGGSTSDFHRPKEKTAHSALQWTQSASFHIFRCFFLIWNNGNLQVKFFPGLNELQIDAFT